MNGQDANGKVLLTSTHEGKMNQIEMPGCNSFKWYWLGLNLESGLIRICNIWWCTLLGLRHYQLCLWFRLQSIIVSKSCFFLKPI